MIRVSAGTAAILGLTRASPGEAPTTAYLMAGEGCRFRCAFCPQAGPGKARLDMLSRVTWPRFPLEEVAVRLARAHSEGIIRRACVQVVHGNGAWQQAKAAVELVRRYSSLPVCLSGFIAGSRQLEEVLGWGVDRVGLALDAASEEVYRRVKGGSLEHRLRRVEEAAAMAPGRVTTHLVVGLGETEEEVVRLAGRLNTAGVTVALFAFTPVKGTALEGHPPPALGSYRRVQVACYLVQRGLAPLEGFSFANGRITGYGLEGKEMERLLKDGEAFRTSGCPACNRPYYNERPGKEPYNYPRPLTPMEVKAALEWLVK